MMRNKMTCLVMLALLFVSPRTQAFAGDLKLSGGWHDTGILIDGSEDDWVGKEVYLEDLKGAIGAVNDSEYLYLVVSTQREDLMMKMLMSGFTIWLNGDGKKDRDFGLRFPGMRSSVHDTPPDTVRQKPDLASLLAMADSSPEPEVLGIDETVIARLPRSQPGPTLAVRANRQDRLIYEMRVPLARSIDHPRAIGGEPGGRISVGMETGKVKMDEDRRKMMKDKMGTPPEGGPMGGFGGGRMGRPGGMGGPRPGGGRLERPKPFEMWAKLTLAKPENGSVSEDPE